MSFQQLTTLLLKNFLLISRQPCHIFMLRRFAVLWVALTLSPLLSRSTDSSLGSLGHTKFCGPWPCPPGASAPPEWAGPAHSTTHCILYFLFLFFSHFIDYPLFSGAVCGPGGAGRHQEQAGGPGEEDHRGRREFAGEGGGAGEAAGGQRQGAG
jgi:hypothetical protein